MTFRTCRAAFAGLCLVLVATAPAQAITSRPGVVRPKLGTYKAKESSGSHFVFTVGPCSARPSKLCLESPDMVGQKNNYVDLNCVGLNGAGDGVDDDVYFGPVVIPANGIVKQKFSQPDDFSAGSKQTFTYVFKVSSQGTISGTARLTESFADGAKCDSGLVKITAKH